MGPATGSGLRSLAIRLPFRGAFSITTTSSSAKPAANNRLAIFFAAIAVSPVEWVVSVSTSSLNISRAKR